MHDCALHARLMLAATFTPPAIHAHASEKPIFKMIVNPPQSIKSEITQKE